ncbi:hypothetical protein GCM10010449_42230 [Streptomyces rectiviolaceus]|uniref:Uncharacterized protein n=1 Tax=Streptomyces rectiviolaceus TaxID=332591 RepID=A0ABP6MIR0_9ACTN
MAPNAKAPVAAPTWLDKPLPNIIAMPDRRPREAPAGPPGPPEPAGTAAGKAWL